MNHLLIIGGTKGLGKAFLDMASPVYEKITVLARTVPTGTSANDHVHYIAADVMSQSSLRRALEQATSTPAAINRVVFFQQYRGKEQAWDNNLACILTATRTTLEFLRDHFTGPGDKSVVFLTSTASRLVADEQDEGYHAAKTALLGMGRYYAVKLGPLGVRVNCVSPGTVLKEETKHHILNDPNRHGLFKRIIPLRRMGTAAEVASVIKFLLSTESSFVTGQEIVVDGGASLHSQESLARTLFNENPKSAETRRT